MYFTKCWTISLINRVSALASCSCVTVSMLSMQCWVRIQIWLSSVNFFPCEIVQSHVYHHTSPQQKEHNKLQTCRSYLASSDEATECVYKGLIKDDSSFLFMNHGIFPSMEDGGHHACSPRCPQPPASLIHMFWSCPSLHNYWLSIFEMLSGVH